MREDTVVTQQIVNSCVSAHHPSVTTMPQIILRNTLTWDICYYTMFTNCLGQAQSTEIRNMLTRNAMLLSCGWLVVASSKRNIFVSWKICNGLSVSSNRNSSTSHLHNSHLGRRRMNGHVEHVQTTFYDCFWIWTSVGDNGCFVDRSQLNAYN